MSYLNTRELGACALWLLGACTATVGESDARRADGAMTDTSSPMDIVAPPDTPASDIATIDTPAGDDVLTADAGDTGARDAPPPRDVPDAGPCGGAMFCEPFESYAAMSLRNNQTFGPWRAALSASGSTMALDGMHTVSGSRALHVHIDDAVTAGGRLFSSGMLPVLASHPTHLYGRLMMYINPNGTSIHWTFFGVNGPAVPGPASGRNASYIISSLPRAGVNTYSFVYGLSAQGTDPYHDCSTQGMTQMPTGRWSCVTWEMDSVARRLRLYVDGGTTPIVSVDDHGRGCVGSVPATSPWYGPAIDQFFTGAWSFHPMMGPLDVWIDDLVLDTAPVACPGP